MRVSECYSQPVLPKPLSTLWGMLLATRRERLGLSRQQLAAACAMSAEALKRIESGDLAAGNDADRVANRLGFPRGMLQRLAQAADESRGD